MSALGLFRPSTTTQAFAFASRPPTAMQHACHPRYKSRLTFSDKEKEYSNKISARVKHLENQARAVMADPRLDEEQKYRATKRHFAQIDLHTAFKDSLIAHQKAVGAVQHFKGLGREARFDYYQKVARGILQECLGREGELSTVIWQCGKLHVFAHWGEIGLHNRIVLFVGVLPGNRILLPLHRLSLGMLSIMKISGTK
jgi:hypothetical protein